jgi:hypothetical protein
MAEECPRCSDEGIIVYLEGADQEAYRIIVPWTLIEETISTFVKDAVDGMGELKESSSDES